MLDVEATIAAIAAWAAPLPGFAVRCARQHNEAIARIIATSEEYARANVPADPFVCPCGEVLDEPCNPAVMAIHQPHHAAAKAARQGGT